MALARAGMTLSNEEDQLRKAVAQFEKDLDVDQQRTLYRYRIEAHQSPPNISDVMRITAEIDREVSKNKMFRGRCFGPRFTNILQSVQQFASIGDVIIGGSQNLIACGVWSLVRFSLLLMANFSSCVERFSKLLLEVGRASPRYQEMALLYPQSRSLQSNMCEYFTVVVRLCHQLVKLTKESVLQQMISFLKDQDMKDYQSELDQLAISIKEEVYVLMNKSIEEQRSRFKAFMKSEAVRRREKAKIRVLNYCSTYDYQSTWKELRKAGNTRLFERSAGYRKWKVAKESSTLICQGKLGSGKSVLVANMISDLTIDTGVTRCPAAYFFCRHNIHESLKAHTIIGSLIRQLLEYMADFTRLERKGYALGPRVDFDIAQRILQHAFPTGLEAYVIVDGLDECDESDKEMVCDQLQILQKKFNLRVCISVRLEPDTPFSVHAARFMNTTCLSTDDNTDEIADFIYDELTNVIETQRLRLTDPTLVLEIADALQQGAQGMFLWVALQIAALCEKENQTDADIRRALKNLPKDLHETFSRILQRATEGGKGYQARVLESLTSVYRPLTTEELQEALSVIPGNSVLDRQQFISDIHATLASCGSLVVVDEESLTVRIVDQSVVQFLFGEFKGATKSVITRKGAAKTMGETVVTYLCYDGLNTQLSTMVAPQIPASEIPAKILRSVDLPSNFRSIALRLLRSRKQPGFNLGNLLAESSKATPSYHSWVFYGYAKEHWLQHSRYLDSENSEMLQLLFLVAQQEIILDRDDTLLLWAMRQEHEPIAKAVTKAVGTIKSLIRAIESAEWRLVLNLINTIAWRYETYDYRLWQAAASASLNGGQILRSLFRQAVALEHVNGLEVLGRLLEDSLREENTGIIDHLVEQKYFVLSSINKGTMDLERSTTSGQPLLYMASCGATWEITELLLQAGANVNSAETERGETPLFGATRNQRLENMKLLIDQGADPNAVDRFGDAVLITAASQKNAEAVRLLLYSGADPDAESASGGTALTCALLFGGEMYPCIEALLIAGAEVTCGKLDGLMFSSYALKKGLPDIALLLLKRQPNLDEKDDDGLTPLHRAVEGHHLNVVKFLLDKGADIDVPTASGETAFWIAGQAGNLDIAKHLLAIGADPKLGRLASNHLAQPPLFLAAFEECWEAMESFLLRGVSLDMRDVRGRTALSYAAEGGCKAAVQFLISRGADANIRDNAGLIAYFHAILQKHHEIADILRPHIRDPEGFEHHARYAVPPKKLTSRPLHPKV